jgi:RNA polymerase sigma-70 factor (ECF subfamily)
MEDFEKQIIQKCQNGDLEEFDRLYKYYFDRIYRFVAYRVLDKQIAEDITSQTFFKALKSIKGFSAGKGNFSSWIYRIARNNIIDYYRGNKSNLDISEMWNLRSSDNLENEVETQEKIGQALDALKKLTKEHQEILIMRIWDNLPYKEIALITGKSEANCKVIFSRSIQKLKKEVVLSLVIMSLIIQNL